MKYQGLTTPELREMRRTLLARMRDHRKTLVEVERALKERRSCG